MPDEPLDIGIQRSLNLLNGLARMLTREPLDERSLTLVAEIERALRELEDLLTDRVDE